MATASVRDYHPSMEKDWTYQAELIAAINAELGARGWSRRELLTRAGLSENTMERVFRLQRDLNVRQIEQMAAALGVAPEYIARQAAMRRGEVVPPSEHAGPPAGADVRTIILWLLEHPEDDAELTTRLGEAATQVDASGKQMARLFDTIREVRRAELMQALQALPPSQGQGGSSAVGE